MYNSGIIRLQVPAKINLYLKVLRKRPDGYHDIDTLMQAISLYDEMTLEKSEKIEIHCEGLTDLEPGDNLAYKAAALLSEIVDFPGVHITLIKNIPQGAGLGGGSADAAFVIRGLIALYGLKPDKVELSRRLVSLGADIPFFMGNGQSRATGIGDQLQSMPLPLDYQVVIVKPDISINTAWAYKNLKIPMRNAGSDINLEKQIRFADLIRVISKTGNDFEDVAFGFSGDLVSIKKQLILKGALYASMSGSGSAMFGIFTNDIAIEPIVAEFRASRLQSYACKPILLDSLPSGE
jgi:4-diphosphocytidyl-2-C-methyl-D-erythritol kinase